ncbi:MAG: hypothetical protein ACM3S2_15450 [Ignavibacteriales bacterium]
MKSLNKHLLLFTALLLIASLKVNAQVNAGISIGNGGLNSFYLSIGNYFSVPEREVIVVRERRIPDEEIPVVFYLARRARVSPREIAGMRSNGYSWMEITYHYGLGPDIYVQGRPAQGPPYGKAWGYYKKHGGYGNRGGLSDYEVISAVNSRFLSERHHCQPEEIVRLRNQGYNYVDINDRYVRGNGRGSRNDDEQSYHQKGWEKHQDKWEKKHGHGRDDD